MEFSYEDITLVSNRSYRSVWASGQSVAQQPSDSPAALDTVKIEQLTGIKGKLDTAESVFKARIRTSRRTESLAGRGHQQRRVEANVQFFPFSAFPP